MITYLSSRVGKPEEICDLCIVGAGAAGCELALRLKDSGLSVVIVESGFLDFDMETQRLYRFEQVGHSIRTLDYSKPFTVDDMQEDKLCRYRRFGGTLHVWGRRWMMLEPEDFIKKPNVKFSGWPITYDDLLPYYQEVAQDYGLFEFCAVDEIRNCGHLVTAKYPEFREDLYFKQKLTPTLLTLYYGLLERSRNMKVILGANAVNIELSSNLKQVESILVRSLKGEECKVRAKRFVLASGSIENARLLLCCNSQVKAGIGNESGWVGKNLIDHLKAEIGTFTLSPSVTEFPESYVYMNERGKYGFHIALNSKLQMEKGLTNTNLLFIQRKLRIDVHAFIEQRPNPESCITLTGEKDEVGLPIACLDWKVTEQDRLNFVKYMDTMAEYLDRYKIGHFSLIKGYDNLAKAKDTSHQMGTTRMAKDPSQGVVDANCKVFSADNLYVIGSSVFPTSGNANPTFTIFALARRLGDYLQTPAAAQP